MVGEFEPHIGLSAVHTEPAPNPLSPSFSAPPCLCSLSLSKINIRKICFKVKEEGGEWVKDETKKGDTAEIQIRDSVMRRTQPAMAGFEEEVREP